MKIVMIGGGITGLFTSYYLALDGHEVTVLDESTETPRTSIFNAGLITPSTGVVPTIGLASIIGSFFGKSGPVYISPMEVFRNLRWFRIASRRALSGYEKAITELGKESLRLYLEFFKKEQIEPDLIRGIAGLYLDEEYARDVAKASGARFLGQDEVSELGFDKVGGGAYMEEELSINPLKLYNGLEERVKELGVKVQRGRSVSLRVDSQDKRKASVSTSDGEKIIGDKYVVTSGSWTSNILKKTLTYDPLIIPARGLVMLFDTGGETVMRVPALLEDYGIGLCQHDQNTVRITSFFEIMNFKQSFKQSKKNWLLNISKKHLTKFSKLRFSTEGVGFRPCTPDQLPVIGAVPGYHNLYVASGNCRLGVTLAPATGNIIRSMIDSTSATQESWRFFDPGRF